MSLEMDIKRMMAEVIGHSQSKEPVTELTEEVYFRVKIEGFPIVFMTGSSEAGIKQQLRKIVRKPDMIGDVERVTKTEVRKAFRLKSMGKDEDDGEEMEESTGQS